MNRVFIFLFILSPFNCLAQLTISGRILNNKDKSPVVNASVFLSNATIGSETAQNGMFKLSNIKAGKYDVIVSIVGFETFSRSVTVENNDIILPDIMLSQKSIVLKEVSIKYHNDPNREKYYEWFRDEFLGTSQKAQDCKILNPDILDLDYDEAGNKLTASSYEFLEIENDALGYKLKYLLTNFTLENKDEKKIYYQGPVLFQELKGNPAQERRWQKNREEVYENSPMHFLRAAVNDDLTKEGFRVQEYSAYQNPQRPDDSLINARIYYYKRLKDQGGTVGDSLSYWTKKLKLAKTLYKLQTLPLSKKDIVRPADKPGQYILSRNGNWLYVAYNKTHHFHINDQTSYLYNRNNTENTLIKFNAPEAFFNSSGVISNPYSVIFYGVWGRNRVAEMLPVDYEPPKSSVQHLQENLSASIDSALEKYLAAHPTEKTYLHFDKPYYAAGDTIYFKAYLTMGERLNLSQISGILHVDLINTNNKVDQSVKVQLFNGIGWGDFALPDSLPKGNYRIRAYTQWMRNDGNYFEQIIPIGTVHDQKMPDSGTARSNNNNPAADIQFFAEGGNLINGIRSKIAFKAISPNGLGIEANGSVADNTGKMVTQFKSAHLGVGYFYLEPEAGKKYQAHVTFADGTQNVFDLPSAGTKGVALSINNDLLSKAIVKIESNPAYFQENKGKVYTLLIYSGGSCATVDFKLDSMATTLDIMKRRLHTGITRATLFSPANEPLCERLIFVENYDQLSLSINSGKTSYKSREKVNIKLNAKTRTDSADMGHFSVSVIDEKKVPVNENSETTILSNLLLTSDLKGTIEQPNYYFEDITDEKLKQLDLIMLIHGYRKFEWKQILSGSASPPTWQPEKSLQINGTAENLLGQGLAKASVSLISFQQNHFITTIADNKGNFKFDNLVFSDTANFILQAVKAKGGKNTKLTYSKGIPPEVKTMPEQINPGNSDPLIPAGYLQNKERQQAEQKKLTFGKSKMLKGVEIKAKKSDPVKINSRYGVPDKVVTGKQIGYGGMLSTKLLALIRRPAYLKAPPLIVIDGVEMPMDFDVDQINTGSVKSVEVFLDAMGQDMTGKRGYESIYSITTNQGLQAEDIVATGILPIKVAGYYKAREFYSPKYELTITNPGPDLRSTIYWNPELTTDKDGNASFEYYNADGTGDYRIVIEGIDEKGNIGRQVYRYRVE